MTALLATTLGIKWQWNLPFIYPINFLEDCSSPFSMKFLHLLNIFKWEMSEYVPFCFGPKPSTVILILKSTHLCYFVTF